MPIDLGSAVLRLGADLSGFSKGLAQAEKDVESWGGRASAKLQSAGASITRVGVGMTAGITAPIIGLGMAVLESGAKFDGVMDAIRTTTGATGDTLTGLGDDAMAVFRSIPADMETVGQAIADLNARTGQAGQGLQDLTKSEIELARLTGGDLNSQIASSTRMFGDWGIAVENQVPALDLLLRTNQETGIGVDELANNLVKFGAPLRQMGFDFETSAAMIGKFEQEGVNAELVLGSMRIALGKMAQDGVEPVEGLRQLVKGIQETGSTAEANKLAIEAFGARAGPDMAAAIREGRFSVDELVNTIANGSETIMGAAEDTNDYAEQLKILQNQATAAAIPLGVTLFQAINDLMPTFEKIVSKISELVSSFTALSPETQKFILTFAGVAAAIGPVVTFIGSLTAGVGALIGAFSSGGAAATAITAIGAALGPLLPIIAAVVAAGAALYAAWQTNFLGIRDVVAEVAGVLTDAFGRIKETVTAFVGVLSGSLSFSEFGAQLSTIWSGFGETVGTAFENIKTIVATKWAELVANVTAKAPEIAAAASAWVSTAVGNITAKAGELAAAAVGWLDDTLVKIEAFDLGAAVQTLFGTILPGIVAKTAELLAPVGQWLTDTAAKIAAFDLGAAVATLFGTILPGIAGAVGAALEAVGTFLSDIAAKIAGYTFESDTLTAIQTVVSGILGAAGMVLEAIGSVLGSLAGAVRGFNLADAGAALIAGMIGGIRAKAGELADAARGVVSGAIQAAKNLLGIRSPSKVFAELGEQSMQGLGLGFEAGTAGATNMLLGGLEEVVNALAAWANEQERLNKSASILSAKAVTDPLKEIVGNVAAIGNALTAIAMLRIPGNAADLIRQMTAAMGPVTLALAEFADEQERLNKSTAILSARAVAEPLANVAGNVQRILGGLADLATANIDPARIAARVPAMIEALRTVVTRLAEFARTTALSDLGAAATVGPLLAQVLEPFSAAANAMGAILKFWDDLAEEYKRVRIIDRPDRQGAVYAWMPAVEMVSAMIRGLHAAMRDLQGQIGDITNDLTVFAARLRDLFAPLTAAADAMGVILDFWTNLDESYKRVRIIDRPDRQGKVYAWQAAIDMVAAMAHSLHAAVADLHRKIGDLPQELIDFSIDMGIIGTAMSQSVQFMSDLSAWREAPYLEDKFDRFVNSWGYILKELEKIAKDTAELAYDEMRRFTEAVRVLAEGLSRGLDFLMQLDTWRINSDLETQIATLCETLHLLLTALNQMFAEPPDTEAAEAFATAMGQIGASLIGALDLLGELGASPVGVSLATIEKFVASVRDVVREFIEKVIREFEDEITPEALGAWGEAVGKLAEGLSKQLDLLSVLRGYTDVPDSIIDAFMLDVQRVVRQFIDKIIREFEDEITPETLGAWGEAVGKLAAGLSQQLTLLNNLRDYTDVPDAIIDAFMLDVQRVVGQFIEKVIREFENEVTPEALSAWGEAVGKLAEGLGKQLVLLSVLRGYTDVPDSIIDAFTLDVQRVVGQFIEKVIREFEDEITPDVLGTWGEAVGKLAEGLGKQLELLGPLRNYADVSDTIIENFMLDLNAIVKGFVDWVVNKFDLDQADAVKLWGEAVGKLAEGLGSAMTVLQDLHGYIGPADDRLTEFIDDVEQVVTVFAGKIPALRALIDTVTLTDWGNAIQALFGGLSGALDVLGQLVWYVTPNPRGVPDAQTHLSQFMRDLVAVVTKFRTDLLPLLDAAQLEATAKFAGVLGNMMEALGSAIGTIQGINELVGKLNTAPQGTFAHAVAKFNEAVSLVLSDWLIWYSTNYGTADQIAKLPALLAITNLISGIVGELGRILDGITKINEFVTGTSGPTLNARLLAFNKALADALADWGAKVSADYGTPEKIERLAALQAISGLIGGIFKNLADACNAIANIDYLVTNPATGMGGGFGANLMQFNNLVQAALEDWLTWIETELQPDAAEIETAFVLAIKNLAKALEDAIGLLVTLNAAGVPPSEDVQDFFEAVIGMFAVFTQKLAESSKDIGSGVSNAAKAFVQAIQDSFGSSSPAYLSMWDIGKALGYHLGAGVTQGVLNYATGTSSQNAMYSAAAALVAAFKAQFERAAQISSPSKLFAGVGQNIGAGVAVGVTNSLPMVDAALGDLFALVQPSAQVGVAVTSERDVHIYLHGDGLSDLSPTGRQELVGELARHLKLQGLRAGVA